MEIEFQWSQCAVIVLTLFTRHTRHGLVLLRFLPLKITDFVWILTEINVFDRNFNHCHCWKAHRNVHRTLTARIWCPAPHAQRCTHSDHSHVEPVEPQRRLHKNLHTPENQREPIHDRVCSQRSILHSFVKSRWTANWNVRRHLILGSWSPDLWMSWIHVPCKSVSNAVT